MATRSTIWATFPDGSCKGIYCHNDRYLSYNGEMLINHYNSEELATALVSLGGVSSLDEHLSPLPEAPAAYFWGVGKCPTILASEHSFDRPQEGVTVAYHRDRKEPLSIMDGLEGRPDPKGFQGYEYWWFDGTWHIHEGGDSWAILTHEYIKADQESDEDE